MNLFLYSRFLLVIYFIHISVYMSIPISQFIPPPPPSQFPPLASLRLFSTSVSLFLPCKLVHLYHFSRFHTYALIYDICFSLSDLLHSVWQSLGPTLFILIHHIAISHAMILIDSHYATPSSKATFLIYSFFF